MKKFTEPEILLDNSRLQEIYDLRVYAWEHSPSPAKINRETYPHGFFDELDERAIHWVSFNEAGEIIAAARLAIINEIDELPYPQIFANVSLPKTRPFLFYSRLAIHPDYRKLGLKEKFDLVRLRYQIENEFAFSIATASFKRAKEMLKYGWQDLGKTSNNPNLPFLFGDERSLLLLCDVKLDSESLDKAANDKVDEEPYVCEFQRGMLAEIEPEREAKRNK